MKLGGWIGLSVALLLLAPACGREAPRLEVPPSATRGAVPSARVWLEEINARHAAVDRMLDADDLAGASAALEAALAEAAPASVDRAHARVIHQDLSYRLAEVKLRQRAFGVALEVADRGLALGGHLDVFVANLHVVRGRALEGLARGPEAATSYFRALEINEALLERVLDQR